MDYLRARKQSEMDERRRAILEAGQRLFAQRGVDETTIEQIATACSLSRSLIYTYFLDKSHLFVVAVASALDELHADFERTIERRSNGLDRIAAIGQAYVAFARTRPDAYETILRFQFSKPRLPDPSERPTEEKKAALFDRWENDVQRLLTRADAINRLMAQQIEAGVRDGSIRSDIGDPTATAIALWATVGGLIQTTAATEAMLTNVYALAVDDVIAQGLAVARQGLRNQGGTP